MAKRSPCENVFDEQSFPSRHRPFGTYLVSLFRGPQTRSLGLSAQVPSGQPAAARPVNLPSAEVDGIER